jgi:hypothetical protein
LAIAGFGKFLSLVESRFRSHDAEPAGDALANGQRAIYGRVHRSVFGERGVHFYRAQGSEFGRFVKIISPLAGWAARVRLDSLT